VKWVHPRPSSCIRSSCSASLRLPPLEFGSLDQRLQEGCRDGVLLRPPDTRRRRRCGEHLTGSVGDHLIHVLDASPFGGHHEECSSVRTPEHARVARAVELDPLQDLAALANPCAGVVAYSLSGSSDALRALPALLTLFAQSLGVKPSDNISTRIMMVKDVHKVRRVVKEDR
jgi:hypothetical protein